MEGEAGRLATMTHAVLPFARPYTGQFINQMFNDWRSAVISQSYLRKSDSGPPPKKKLQKKNDLEFLNQSDQQNFSTIKWKGETSKLTELCVNNNT